MSTLDIDVNENLWDTPIGEYVQRDPARLGSAKPGSVLTVEQWLGMLDGCVPMQVDALHWFFHFYVKNRREAITKRAFKIVVRDIRALAELVPLPESVTGPLGVLSEDAENDVFMKHPSYWKDLYDESLTVNRIAHAINGPLETKGVNIQVMAARAKSSCMVSQEFMEDWVKGLVAPHEQQLSEEMASSTVARILVPSLTDAVLALLLASARIADGPGSYESAFSEVQKAACCVRGARNAVDDATLTEADLADFLGVTPARVARHLDAAGKPPRDGGRLTPLREANDIRARMRTTRYALRELVRLSEEVGGYSECRRDGK